MQRCRAAGDQGAWRRAVCALVLLLLLASGGAAQAESAPLVLNLPAQDLEHALQAYSRATGMAVLVDRELTRGRRSIGVHGRFTAQEALAMLLTGSGLMARYARSDAFTLQTPEVSPPPTTRGAAARQAARSLNIKATLLRKRLAQLEEQVRHVLFCYQGNGLVLSRDGQQLQAQLVALAHARRLPVVEQPLIRLAVAEPILHDILGRDLIALLRRNASVRLEIISLDSHLSLQAVDVDVVLWLADGDSPVPGPSFATESPRALARLHYLPHIAKRYSRLTTRPDSVEDLTDYMLVQWQPDAQVDALQPWNQVVQQRLAAVVQVQAYSLMLEMIRCGACIGLLPHYMSSFDRGLVALPGLLADSMQRRVWLAVNAQVKDAEAVQGVVELIVGTFEGRREWFD